MAPTFAQFLWLAAAMVLLLAALLAAIPGLTATPKAFAFRRLARLLTLAACLVDLGLIVYRNTIWRRGCPIETNFGSAMLLVIMLGGLLLYLQSRTVAGGDSSARTAGPDLVVLPLMVAFQALAGAIYLLDRFQHFRADDVWRPLHLAGLAIGAAFLAAAAVAATMYLLADRALRKRQPGPLRTAWPSLERLDRLVQRAVLGGFVMLTFGLVAGAMVLWRSSPKPSADWLHWKVLLSAGVWLVCVAILHVRFAPQHRGRRTAWAAVAAFGLILAAYFASQAISHTG